VDGEGWNTRNPTAMTNGDRPQFMIPPTIQLKETLYTPDLGKIES